jgi:epsilon-lactone hydrolase
LTTNQPNSGIEKSLRFVKGTLGVKCLYYHSLNHIFMKHLITCIVFFILISYSSFGQIGSTTDRQIFVPTTISGPAQKTLEMGRKSGFYKTAYPAPDDTAGWRKAWFEQETASAENIARLMRDPTVTIKDSTIAGIPVLDVKPKGWKENGKLIIFTHGGAYTLNSARSGLPHVVPFVKMSGYRVISINYTTAPFAKWDKVQAEVVDVFKALLSKGYKMKNMGIYGASAGGGLAVCTVLNLRDQGLGMPAAAVLWSPWADLTNEGDSPTTLEQQEPFLSYPNLLEPSAKAYANGLSLKDPRISPVYADFKKGFSPVLIQEGTKTIFLSTSIRLYQRLDEAGQKPVIDMYEGMVHVFQQLPIPEAEYAIGKTADFFRKYLK